MPRTCTVSCWTLAIVLGAASPHIALAQGGTIAHRFAPPPGAVRSVQDPSSFGHYLRHLRLKPEGSKVHLYDGRPKSRQDVHAAVVAVSTGSKDLQQCADAVIRLHAEHLFAQGAIDRIAYTFTNGWSAPFSRWATGQRIRVSGNRCSWVNGSAPDRSHTALLAYLEQVFMYAGTRSLARDLVPVTGTEVRSGDVYVQGGSPGHAVIVVDVARSIEGRTYIMLAQSYMPAQDIHVLRGPVADVWYEVGSGDVLRAPEWTFAWSDRARWP